MINAPTESITRSLVEVRMTFLRSCTEEKVRETNLLPLLSADRFMSH